jgi:hypothetical protein
MKALIRTKKIFRPYSQKVLGYRVQATIPNMAARKMRKVKSGFVATEQEVPSFRAPYLICESMDYATERDISKGDMERFVLNLLSLGFTEFEML